MSNDLSELLHAWPYDPEDDNENVRCVRGKDGSLRLQLRVRCGIFQWEFEGRPDGQHPRGFASLLDYYRQRVAEHRREAGAAEPLRLGPEEVAEISQELVDYYQRRVLFFRLGQYDRARADAEHNLALMDILREHAEDSETVAEHERWRPFITMDRTRAQALLGCERGDYLSAIRTLEHGIAEIADFFRTQRRPDLVQESQEIHLLEDLKYQLREAYGIPLTRQEMLQGLREEQAKAIAEEDFERAARLRDEIERLEDQPDAGTP